MNWCHEVPDRFARADDWDEVVLYGQANRVRLKEFLELPNGIPCADTFRRLFARLNPLAFELCFIEWSRSLASLSHGRLIAIDGKTLRRSFAHGWNKQMVHLVSAWCSENQLVLGQLAVDGKSNEITAIPKLLELLHLRQAVVSIDEKRRVWVSYNGVRDRLRGPSLRGWPQAVV